MECEETLYCEVEQLCSPEKENVAQQVCMTMKLTDEASHHFNINSFDPHSMILPEIIFYHLLQNPPIAFFHDQVKFRLKLRVEIML
jgi:hypothetical protein